MDTAVTMVTALVRDFKTAAPSGQHILYTLFSVVEVGTAMCEKIYYAAMPTPNVHIRSTENSLTGMITNTYCFTIYCAFAVLHNARQCFSSLLRATLYEM